MEWLIEITCAAHLTAYVDSPWSSRGGIMLVSRAEGMKTTVLTVLEHYHPAALVMSDITVKGLSRVRDELAYNATRTLVFLDMHKIYERHLSTALNVEGALRAMADEGFSSLAFEDQSVNRLRATGLIVGAMTPSLQDQHSERWERSGFTRRFLWLVYRLDNPEFLQDAIEKCTRLDIGKGVIPVPRDKKIPFRVRESDTKMIRDVVRYQKGQTIPFQLLIKIFAVLSWHGGEKYARQLVEAMRDVLGREGGTVQLARPASLGPAPAPEVRGDAATRTR